jgi:transcription elongation factor GreA
LSKANDPVFDELFTLARKAAAQSLEAKFKEAFAAAPDRLDDWLRIAEEMKSTGKRTQAGNLLALTIDHYEKSGSAEQRVRLLAFVAGALEKDRNHRLALARALQEHHAASQAIDLFLDACGLRADTPVDAAFADLQRMWDYDVGRYVHHATGWGIGRIDGVDAVARELQIRFEGDRQHSMPVRSALQTLKPVSADDWRVLKHFKADELRTMCAQDPGEAIARVLRQLNRPADVATVRICLEGAIIPAAQWSRFWTGARKAALQRPDVELQGTKIVWRQVNADDRLGAMKKVMTARQVLDLANTMLKGIAERGAPDPKVMADLVPVLCEGAKKHAPAGDSSALELLLLADEIAEAQKLPREALDQQLRQQFSDERAFFRRLSDLGNPKLERRALDRFREACGAQYADRLLALLGLASARLLDLIVPELIDAGRSVDLRAALNEAMRKLDSLPELLVFARRRCGQPRFAAMFEGIEPRALVERCFAMGESQGKAHDPRLRALQRQVAKELSDGGGKEFRALVKGLSLENARLLKRKIEMLRGLTEHTHIILLQVFGEVHKELAKKDDVLPPHLDPTVIWCTDAGIRKRNAEYEHLTNVDLPNIFAAVGRAAAFGDLSENAEYTAALEERSRLTKRAEEMVEEIRRAKPITADLLEDGKVTIGSTVAVREAAGGALREFTFLGPWDADLDKGRLDYRAGFARSLIGRKVGETVAAELGGKSSQFEIVAVRPAI